MAQEILTRFTADIKDIQKKLKAIDGKLGGVDKASKKINTALRGIGKSATNVATRFSGIAAATALVVKSIDKIKKFEKAVDELSSITGAVGKDLDFLKNQALEIGKSTTIGATQAVNAFKLIASARPELLKDSAALAEVTKQAVILAEASGLELEPAALALAGTMNQFGVASSEAARIINVLAAGSKEGAAAIPQISAAIDRFGTVAAAANISVEESVGLVETLAEKNIQGAEAGTQLRNIILKLQAANIGYVDGIFDINAALIELKEKNLSAAEASKLFGLESVVAGNILTDNIDKVALYTEKVTGTNTATEQAETNTKNLSSEIVKLGNAWDTFIVSLDSGDGALSRVVRAMVKFADATIQLGSTLATGNFLGPFAHFLRSGEKITKEESERRRKIFKEIQFLQQQENKRLAEAAAAEEAANQKVADDKLFAQKEKEREKELEARKKANEKLAKEQKKKNDELAKIEAERVAKIQAASDQISDAEDEARRVRAELISDDRERELELAEQAFQKKYDNILGESEQENELRELLLEEWLQKKLEINENFDNLEIEHKQEVANAKKQIEESLQEALLGFVRSARALAKENAGVATALLLFEKAITVRKLILGFAQQVAEINKLYIPPANIPVIALAAADLAFRLGTVAAVTIPQVPGFHKGTDYVNGKTGVDQIPAMLTKGESVGTVASNKAYPGLAKAMNAQKVDEWFLQDHGAALIGAIKKAEFKKNRGFAENVANSLMAKDKFYDGNIVDHLVSGKTLSKKQHQELIKTIKGTTYKNNRFG